MKTKIVLLIVSVCLVANVSVSAQENIMLGIKTGLNSSNFYNSFSPDTKNRYSFSYGISSQFNFSDQFSTMVEAMYLPMGMRFKDDSNDFKIKNSYLQLSIKPMLYLTDNSSFLQMIGFYINSGPYFSYLLSSKIKGDISIGNTLVFDKCNSTDYGIVFSGGFSLLGILSLELNYNLGLSKISTDIGKNHSGGISLIFAYPVKM
jgi:Outer membrane protein beta-barrel domain